MSLKSMLLCSLGIGAGFFLRVCLDSAWDQQNDSEFFSGLFGVGFVVIAIGVERTFKEPK